MPLFPIDVSPDRWDAFVEARGGHVLQTAAWGRLKAAFGWQHQLVVLGEGLDIAAGASVLYRRLIPGVVLAYVARGPVVDWADEGAVAALLTALDSTARPRGALALKIEPDRRDTPEVRRQLTALGFRPSPQTVQPPRTILIDISAPPGDREGDDDEVLMRMSGSTRRKVRLPYRKDIAFRRGKPDDLDSFNQLMQATGQRNEFGVHDPAYYRQAYELFAPDRAQLFMASYQGQDVAALMAFHSGGAAIYMYGASIDEARERMPTYGLQWEAINWAREHGCHTYDMWGVPDEDEAALEAHFQDRHDGLWGPYGMKRGFGGEVVRFAGAWDRVYRPLLYAGYAAAARLRA
jgi:lipid II:glycine glycyltransferase (peptidoglycan interpeptide bridge formation enzyme)